MALSSLFPLCSCSRLLCAATESSNKIFPHSLELSVKRHQMKVEHRFDLKYFHESEK